MCQEGKGQPQVTGTWTPCSLLSGALALCHCSRFDCFQEGAVYQEGKGQPHGTDIWAPALLGVTSLQQLVPGAGRR